MWGSWNKGMRMGSVQANKEESSLEKTGGKANSRHEGRKAEHGRRMLDTAVGQCGHVSLSGGRIEQTRSRGIYGIGRYTFGKGGEETRQNMHWAGCAHSGGGHQRRAWRVNGREK